MNEQHLYSGHTQNVSQQGRTVSNRCHPENDDGVNATNLAIWGRFVDAVGSSPILPTHSPIAPRSSSAGSSLLQVPNNRHQAQQTRRPTPAPNLGALGGRHLPFQEAGFRAAGGHDHTTSRQHQYTDEMGPRDLVYHTIHQSSNGAGQTSTSFANQGPPSQALGRHDRSSDRQPDPQQQQHQSQQTVAPLESSANPHPNNYYFNQIYRSDSEPQGRQTGHLLCAPPSNIHSAGPQRFLQVADTINQGEAPIPDQGDHCSSLGVTRRPQPLNQELGSAQPHLQGQWPGFLHSFSGEAPNVEHHLFTSQAGAPALPYPSGQTFASTQTVRASLGQAVVDDGVRDTSDPRYLASLRQRLGPPARPIGYGVPTSDTPLSWPVADAIYLNTHVDPPTSTFLPSQSSCPTGFAPTQPEDPFSDSYHAQAIDKPRLRGEKDVEPGHANLSRRSQQCWAYQTTEHANVYAPAWSPPSPMGAQPEHPPSQALPIGDTLPYQHQQIGQQAVHEPRPPQPNPHNLYVNQGRSLAVPSYLVLPPPTGPRLRILDIIGQNPELLSLSDDDLKVWGLCDQELSRFNELRRQLFSNLELRRQREEGEDTLGGAKIQPASQLENSLPYGLHPASTPRGSSGPGLNQYTTPPDGLPNRRLADAQEVVKALLEELKHNNPLGSEIPVPLSEVEKDAITSSLSSWHELASQTLRKLAIFHLLNPTDNVTLKAAAAICVRLLNQGAYLKADGQSKRFVVTHFILHGYCKSLQAFLERTKNFELGGQVGFPQPALTEGFGPPSQPPSNLDETQTAERGSNHSISSGPNQVHHPHPHQLRLAPSTGPTPRSLVRPTSPDVPIRSKARNPAVSPRYGSPPTSFAPPVINLAPTLTLTGSPDTLRPPAFVRRLDSEAESQALPSWQTGGPTVLNLGGLGTKRSWDHVGQREDWRLVAGSTKRARSDYPESPEYRLTTSRIVNDQQHPHTNQDTESIHWHHCYSGADTSTTLVGETPELAQTMADQGRPPNNGCSGMGAAYSTGADEAAREREDAVRCWNWVNRPDAQTQNDAAGRG